MTAKLSDHTRSEPKYEDHVRQNHASPPPGHNNRLVLSQYSEGLLDTFNQRAVSNVDSPWPFPEQLIVKVLSRLASREFHSEVSRRVLLAVVLTIDFPNPALWSIVRRSESEGARPAVLGVVSIDMLIVHVKATCKDVVSGADPVSVRWMNGDSGSIV